MVRFLIPCVSRKVEGRWPQLYSHECKIPIVLNLLEPQTTDTLPPDRPKCVKYLTAKVCICILQNTDTLLTAPRNTKLCIVLFYDSRLSPRLSLVYVISKSMFGDLVYTHWSRIQFEVEGTEYARRFQRPDTIISSGFIQIFCFRILRVRIFL